MTGYSDFKEFELSGWEKRAESYLARTETLTEPIMAKIVKQLKIEPGKKALDLASGPGYGASEMSLLGAEVLGTDFATSMVEIAKKRYPDIKFERHDAEKLTLESESFDRVLCAFGMLHFAYPERVLSEVYRVLKPSGRFVFSVWVPPEEFPMFGILGSIISKLGDFDVGLPPGPPMEKFAIEAAARECLAETNLEIETFHHASFEANLGPEEVITKWYREISVHSQGLLDSQIPEKMLVVESELIKRFKEFERNGSVHLPFPYRIVFAVK